jgi:predicted PurR-regulated permease PerM
MIRARGWRCWQRQSRLPVGARLASLMGLGELLGLLLAVPLASCGKTFLDAWAVRLRASATADQS